MKDVQAAFAALLERLGIEPTAPAARLLAGAVHAILTSTEFDLGALDGLSQVDQDIAGNVIAALLDCGLGEDERLSYAKALRPFVQSTLH